MCKSSRYQMFWRAGHNSCFVWNKREHSQWNRLHSSFDFWKFWNREGWTLVKLVPDSGMWHVKEVGANSGNSLYQTSAIPLISTFYSFRSGNGISCMKPPSRLFVSDMVPWTEALSLTGFFLGGKCFSLGKLYVWCCAGDNETCFWHSVLQSPKLNLWAYCYPMSCVETSPQSGIRRSSLLEDFHLSLCGSAIFVANVESR